MSNPTTPFSWQMPTATDLVTDLPADFEVFGQAVATSMADLLGGTSGQILAKNSNTDMDFVWVANDVGDITAVTAGTGISGGGTSGAVTITNSMATEITAKGDLIVGTGSATFDNLAAGANGSTIVANSATSTGLAYIPTFFAGKNKVINGDFGVWQRGTTTTSTTAASTFLADRFVSRFDFTSGTATISQQTFTPGTAPVAGYESAYFQRLSIPSGASSYMTNGTRIEDVRTFAGQTVTMSFWAKSSVAQSGNMRILQNFGSGGSADVDNTAAISLTTSWARYTMTVTLGSMSGKTIGAGSYLQAAPFSYGIWTSSSTIDLWGVQLEAGSGATSFQTATGTIQGELAACQRYYFRTNWQALTAYAIFGTGAGNSATQIRTDNPFPVSMRINPTAIDFPAIGTYFTLIKYDDTTAGTVSAVALDTNLTTTTIGRLNWTVTTGVANTPFYARGANSTAAYLGWSAEL
jgi:hypothetical protein